MKADEAPDPAQVGRLGTVAVMLDPDPVPHNVQQPRFRHNPDPGICGKSSSKPRLNSGLVTSKPDYPGCFMRYSTAFIPSTLS